MKRFLYSNKKKFQGKERNQIWETKEKEDHKYLPVFIMREKAIQRERARVVEMHLDCNLCVLRPYFPQILAC